MNFSAMVLGRTTRWGALLMGAGTLLLLGGCGIGPAATGGGGGGATPLAVTGNVHGGQQPVSHAVVTLYASGSTGYGSAATALAHTSTAAGSGNFSFVKTDSGSSNNSDNTWHCPTDGTDPLIYLIAKGGNPNGTSATDADNPAIALGTVLGRCSQVTTSTFAVINEMSTVAMTTAFGPYIDPALENLGSNGAIMASGTSSQSAVGLLNAFASFNNLVSIASGQAVSANTYPGTGTAAGVTVTATPESGKLATMANILAACVNSTATGGTSGACAQLFAGATPPQYPAQTSMPSATYNAAADTLQAALYMATNPTNAGTFTPCGASYTTNAQCLYALVSSFSVFPGSVTAAPQDWTVGINYTASGTCTGGAFFNGVAKEAIDASGNIWFINGTSNANATVGEMSPSGQPIYCYSTSSTKSGRGITIDPTGNVWASFNTGGGIVEFPAATPGTPVSWTTANNPYTILSDPWGNIFYTQTTAGGNLYETVDPGPLTTGAASSTSWVNVGSNISGVSGSSVSLLTAAADNSGRVWTTNITSGASNVLGGIVPNATPINQLTVVGNVGTFGTPSTNTFVAGNQVAFYGMTSGGKSLNYVIGTVVTSDGATFSAVLSSPDIALTSETGSAFLTGSASGYTVANYNVGTAPIYGLAIDPQGSITTGATCCSSGAPYRVFDKITYTGGTFSKSVSPLYLAGINGARSLTVDGASNMWAGYLLPNDSTNTLYSVGEFFSTGTGTTATFTSLSPNGTAPATCSTSNTPSCTTGGGFLKAGLLENYDIAVDPSGSVWALNSSTATGLSYTGNSITQIVGAAVPVITPTSVAQRTQATQTMKP